MAGKGAPIGNTNAAKAKRWEAAIVRAVEAWPNQPNSEGCNPLMVGLNAAAHAFVAQMFEDKDIAFFKEFGDRLDGKSAQAISIDDKRSLEELSDAELDAAEQAITALLPVEGSTAGEGPASGDEPTGSV